MEVSGDICVESDTFANAVAVSGTRRQRSLASKSMAKMSLYSFYSQGSNYFNKKKQFFLC